MELQQDRPPDYVQRSPETIEWPPIPQHAPEQPRPGSDITLPDLKTVLSPEFEQMSPQPGCAASPVNSVRSLPRIDPGYHTLQDHGRGVDTVMAGLNETDSVMSYEDNTGRSASRALSVEDPDVRAAAEALSGLGNPNHFVRGHDKIHVPSHESHARASGVPENPEPLLELVSAAHPWVGGTMKGSLTAYETAKYYSPRIVRYGVNFAERNIGTPVVSAVGSVSQITGVEAGLRRYLDARRPNDIERGDKNMDSSMDVDEEMGARPRENSIPPPYGASRPPSYREEASPASAYRSREVGSHERPSQNRSWSSQLFVSTSGLSVALSTTSRKSLRMCLSFLSAQAGYLQQLSKALSLALSNYEQRRQEYRNNSDSALEKGERPSTPDQDESARRLAAEIRQHCDAIWKTLQHAVTTVSSYTGAALPQNAREFVRLQLMSLPQRWRIVVNSQQGESETSRTAQRMIDFSSEGLDMMSQVAGVLKATLDSAEGWLAAVGKREQQASSDDQQMQDASTASQAESEKS